jgi:signal peptidase I
MVLMPLSPARSGRRILAMVAALAAVLGLQGCGGGGSETAIRASVHAYVTAVAKHDAARACARVTPLFWSATAQEISGELAGRSPALPGNDCVRGFERVFSLLSASAAAPTFTLTDVSVHGRTATAMLATGASASVSGGQDARFIKGSNGVWRIDCCAGRQLDQLPTVTYRIPSGSMLPTLKVGQTVTSNNAAMRAHPPALGDIVVFHPPKGYDAGCADPSEGQAGGANKRACGVARTGESSLTFIKRVVGLPGDRIAIIGGHVYRNGIREQEPYIAACLAAEADTCQFPVPITVPPGDYYMLGDNRGASDDSRFWGPVPRAWIVGVLER